MHYGLRRKSAAGPSPVYLLRLQPPGGTLLVSLRPEAPGIALFAEGEAPEGEKDPGAERLGGLLADKAISRMTMGGIDRIADLALDGGAVLRLDLRPPRPALLFAEGGVVRFALPGNSKIRPGEPLPEPPGAGRPDVATFDPATLPGTTDETEIRRFFRRNVRSLSKRWIDEVFCRARFDEAPEAERRSAIAAAWRSMTADLESEAGVVLYRDGDQVFLSAVPLFSVDEEGESFDDAIAGAAAWALEADEAAGRAGIAGALGEALRRERKRVTRRLEKLRGEMAEAERYPLYRKQGEVLSIHFARIARGASTVRFPDPYDGGEIEITLDPAKSPRENIARLFKKAKRGERGVPVVAGRIDDAEKTLAKIESLLAETEAAATEEEAEAVAERARPYLKEPPAPPVWKGKIKKPKDREIPIHPREYEVTGGFTVLVGKDDRENDLLTTRVARPGDLWFHASQCPGSHVVLLRDDARPVPGDAILQAAAIAAHYSKARHASKVPVVYTEKRYVRKPRGWPPGKVTLTREKTIFVEPALPPEKSSP